MKPLHLLLFGGLALAALSRSKTRPSPQKTAPPPADLPFFEEKAAQAKALLKKMQEGITQSAAALAMLRIEIQRANQSATWSEPSKQILRQVDAAILQGPTGEGAALSLLRSLPEGERLAFTSEVAKAFGRKELSYPAGYARGVWEYMHFGGVDSANLKEAQDYMKVPTTGKLDATTLAAVRRLTRFEIWPKVIG